MSRVAREPEPLQRVARQSLARGVAGAPARAEALGVPERQHARQEAHQVVHLVHERPADPADALGDVQQPVTFVFVIALDRVRNRSFRNRRGRLRGRLRDRRDRRDRRDPATRRRRLFDVLRRDAFRVTPGLVPLLRVAPGLQKVLGFEPAAAAAARRGRRARRGLGHAPPQPERVRRAGRVGVFYGGSGILLPPRAPQQVEQHAIHGAQVRSLSPRGLSRVQPVLEQVLVVRVPARAERERGRAVELGRARAHRVGHQAVVGGVPRRVRHGVKRASRAVRDVPPVPPPRERRERGPRERFLFINVRLVRVARRLVSRRRDGVLLQAAAVGTKAVLHLRLERRVGVLADARGFVLRGSQRRLERLPLEHERSRLRERALLRPLGVVWVTRLEVDVHDGNPGARLERGGQFFRQVERFSEQVAALGVSPQLARGGEPPEHADGALEHVRVLVRVERQRGRGDPVPRLARLILQPEDEKRVQRVHDGQPDVQPRHAFFRDRRELVRGPSVLAVPAPGVPGGRGHGPAALARGNRGERGVVQGEQRGHLGVRRGRILLGESQAVAPVLARHARRGRGGGVQEPREGRRGRPERVQRARDARPAGGVDAVDAPSHGRPRASSRGRRGQILRTRARPQAQHRQHERQRDARARGGPHARDHPDAPRGRPVPPSVPGARSHALRR